MRLRAPEFPAASVGTVALAVIAVGYVLASTAPHVRNFRDANRAWRAAATAARDANAKLLELQASMAKAQASVEGASSLVEASTSVAFVRSLRADVATFMDDLDSAVLAIETARAKVRALKKYRAFILEAAPSFAEALASFEASFGDLAKLRATAEAARDGDFLAQVDRMPEVVTGAASDETLRLARELAKTRPRPSAAEAVRSLEDIHAFASAHGIKFNG
jgi:hypothetical protein